MTTGPAWARKGREMSVNPHLLWIIGATVEPDDPRFDREVFELIDNDEKYYGETEVPVLSGEGTWEDWDFVTSMPIKYLPEKRPELGDLYYYGGTMNASPDKPNGIVGYILSGSHDRYLFRGLSLVPGFEALFENGYVELPQRDDLERDLEYRHPRKRQEGEAALSEHRFIEMF